MATVPDELAARLEGDLRGRFPEISVRFAKADDGSWVCRIEDRSDVWGEVSTAYEDGDELLPTDTERLLAEVTLEVADNLWPDELTDPWSVCASHGDHPFQVQFAAVAPPGSARALIPTPGSKGREAEPFRQRGQRLPPISPTIDIMPA